MLTIALRGLRANRARYTATIVAIVAGVGFLAAGLIVTDSIRASLGGDAAGQYPSVAAAVQPAGTDATLDPRVSADVVATIQGVPTVTAAVGVLTGPLPLFDTTTGDAEEPATDGSLWVTVDALNPLTLESGRAPAATGEIALDRDTAKDAGLALGTSVSIATTSGKQSATVVGITEFGDRASESDNGTISVAAPWAFSVLGDGTVGYTQVLVQGPTGGPDQTELVAALEKAVPSGYVVIDRQTFLSATAGAAGQIADVARPVLLGFALLALFVCGFVIYNTFSVVVAQRTRELALLRAIAATPRQVKRSVRVEGLVIAFLGSVLGVLVGVALTLLMPRVLERFGVPIGSIGITVRPATVFTCLVAGTVITLLSVLAPARRAARTSPIEALRSGPVTTARTTTVRTVVSLALLGGGAALLIGGGTAGQALLIGPGAFLFLFGVLVGGPVIATGFAHLARALTRSTGLTGRLASDNLVRNPKRTATTANALVIGVLLVTFVSIAGATLRDWSVDQINSFSTSDLIVTATTGTIDPALVAQISQIDGVSSTAPVAQTTATVDGNAATVSSGDPTQLADAAGLEVTAGSLAALSTGGIAVFDLFGAAAGPDSTSNTTPGGSSNLSMGNTVTVTAPDGTSTSLPVVAELDFSLTTLSLGNVVGPDTFQTLFGTVGPTVVYLGVDGDDLRSVTEQLDQLTQSYSNVSVIGGSDIGEAIGGLFDFTINAVIALLGMSVIIAIIGIVNTLSLSIFEQRREIGMLRAVGMLPRDVRSMVRLEAVLISMVGTLTGLVAGVFLAYLTIRAIGVGVSWQLPRLGIILVLGVLVGFLAALGPARRVSRIDLLQALHA